jgi:prophage regulatory protein
LDFFAFEVIAMSATSAGARRPKCFAAYLPALLLVLLAAISLYLFKCPNLFVALAFAVPARFLRLPAVLDRVGYSRPSIYRKMREGTFPPNINMGGTRGRGAVAWLESDIDAYMNARVQASRESSPRPDTDQAA